jgi:hypothetical protein
VQVSATAVVEKSLLSESNRNELFIVNLVTVSSVRNFISPLCKAIELPATILATVQLQTN